MAAAASSAASSSATPMQTDKGSLPGLLPWVEKYRPVTLDDVSSLGLAEDERREGGREVVSSYTPCERIASFFLVHAIKAGHNIICGEEGGGFLRVVDLLLVIPFSRMVVVAGGREGGRGGLSL